MNKDIDKDVYQMLLEIGKPVELEVIKDSKTPLPCITYLELNESTNAWGNKLFYNNVAYQVKLWSRKQSDIASMKYDLQLKLIENGWRLSSTTQTSHEGVICLTCTIEAISYRKII